MIITVADDIFFRVSTKYSGKLNLAKAILKDMFENFRKSFVFALTVAQFEILKSVKPNGFKHCYLT